MKTTNGQHTSTGNQNITHWSNIFNTTKDSITMQPSLGQLSTIETDDTILHKTAVLVIMSILIFISLSISGAVLVFCKKKNSVFIYQKSEHEEKDYEYEMDDINTEIDSSENDSIENTEPIRSQTYPKMAAINSTSIKTHYKFIPKSKTFSGIDNQGLQKLSQFGNREVKHPNTLQLSNSFCSSSSPSLNFHSLTIKADVEPCLESQSSEHLNDFSFWNDHSSSRLIQNAEWLKSNSTERLYDTIPWDYDSNSLDTDSEIIFDPCIKMSDGNCLDNFKVSPSSSLTNDFTQSLSLNTYVSSNDSHGENFQVKSKCSTHITENNESNSVRKTWMQNKGSSEDSDDLNEVGIHKPLLSENENMRGYHV